MESIISEKTLDELLADQESSKVEIANLQMKVATIEGLMLVRERLIGIELANRSMTESLKTITA